MTEQPRDPETGQFVSADAVDTSSELVGTSPRTGGQSSELVAAIENVDMQMRRLLANQLGENTSGANDYYETFDWDPNPTTADYYALALRNPYAFAVTFLPASVSWRNSPRIVDDADTGPDTKTDFESDVEDLAREHRVNSYLKRADKLAGIGTFGALVLEFDDVESPDEFDQEVQNPQTLQGLRPFSRESVEDVRLGGPGSGRWGKPLEYQLDLGDENDEELGVTREGPDTIWVHHTRVIHAPATQRLDDEIRGVPRQQPVYNNLIDIERTLGSAGTLAYRASAWGINVNIDKDFRLDDNSDELREHLQRWQYGLDNVLRTHGAKDVQSLGGEDIDPSLVIDPNAEAICAYLGIPQSVLKGNETGERATSEDLKEWYGKMDERCVQYNDPVFVRPFWKRMVEYGIVTPPRGNGFSIEREPLATMSAKDESEIQLNRAKTVKNLETLLAAYGTDEVTEFVETGEFPAVEGADVEAEAAIDESDPQVQAYYEGRFPTPADDD